MEATIDDAEETMEYRILGRTGVRLSVLGFGCGAVGGLMVRGAPADQERAAARALERGINYFDTAAAYGDGASETNLGRVLKALRPEIFLSTKFTIGPEDRGRIAQAIAASLEASLARLGRDHIDLFQLHNRIADDGADRPLPPAVVLGEVVPALERLRRHGKIRFFGITALGDTAALQQVVDAGAFDSAQVIYNLLNPSAGIAVPPGFPGQDFALLLARAHAAGMGTIGIRVLAGGALSGSEARHPIGVAQLEPIASGPDYRTDVARTRALDCVVAAGHAASLIEAGLRFAITNPNLTTTLVGTSTIEQLDTALNAIENGTLPPAAIAELEAAWQAAAFGGAA
jgi:aryl-alcohol dehydrogenase-like predicted oxidoreductase